MSDDSFSALLRRLRVGKGLIQQQLAEKSGIDRAAIAGYESGRRTPTPAVVHKLANALEVDSDKRLSLLDLGGKRALDALEGPGWRKGLRSITGGGSMFGAVLCHLREKKGWSSENLADKSGISYDSIMNYERGGCTPFTDVVHKLADALEATKDNRLLLLDTAGKGALLDLEGPDWRKGLKAIIGGGSGLGALLYRLRVDKGWSHRELANEAGVAQTHIANYEAGDKIPSLANLDKLAKALEVNDRVKALLLESISPKQNAGRS